MKFVGIRIGLHRHLVADVHRGQVALIDVGQHPHRAHIRNDECLGCAGLQQLAGRDIALDDFSADGREQRNFRRRRRLLQIIGVGNSQNFQAQQRCVQIRLRLNAIGFSLQQIAFGDGVVSVEILRAGVIFVGHTIGVARFQVGRVEQRIIRAAHFQKRLAFLHALARHHQNPADRAADLRNYGHGVKRVVSHGTGKAQDARQFYWLDGHDLHVRHLIFGNRETAREFRSSIPCR